MALLKEGEGLGNLRIQKLSTELAQDYDEYLLDKDYSLFYYSTKYKDFIRRHLSCEENYLLAMEGMGYG